MSVNNWCYKEYFNLTIGIFKLMKNLKNGAFLHIFWEILIQYNDLNQIELTQT